MTFRYHLTEAEFFDYNFYTAWASPDKKSYRTRYYLRVFLLYAAVAILFVLTNHSQQMQVDFIIFGLIAVGYFLLVPYLIKRSILKRVKDILRQPENKHVLGATEITFTDDGILDKDEDSETKYSWEAIVRKAETEHCFYLYTNSYHAILLPKRVLQNDADKKELERLLNRFLPLASEFSTATEE